MKIIRSRQGLTKGYVNHRVFRFEGIGFSVGDFWIFRFEVEQIRCGLLVATEWLGTDPIHVSGFEKIILGYDLFWCIALELSVVGDWYRKISDLRCSGDFALRIHEPLLFIRTLLLEIVVDLRRRLEQGWLRLVRIS
ncbi:hypothetical protein F511_23838 [Dorcoceras hygrometricum]|uniref:Uncharacterized protein n=1 Tax=Dorcoceras hygrometricum TaxID=472368 RepID=A0A2Z7BED6_9LAMI|nr:hypothetical protein F511_23838 [Dorcoceras hygrometricum]